MSLLQTVQQATVPEHIGIIMDGNGRWAQKRNLPRTAGHKEGLEAAKRIVRAASECGIKYVTLYTFSTENWKRAEEEVGFLMNLIQVHLRAEFDFYKQNNIRVLHTGDFTGLHPAVQKEISSVIEDTANFTGLTVILAINYGGRDEIIRAAQKCVTSNKEIEERTFANYFDVPNQPDVDLLIRTGGEKRLSNFLLWHAAYAELYFCDTLWPDYAAENFYKAIVDFQQRNRRFGGL